MKNSLKYEELKNMGLPLKNAVEIKALPPYFDFYFTPKEIFNFVLFTLNNSNGPVTMCIRPS